VPRRLGVGIFFFAVGALVALVLLRKRGRSEVGDAEWAPHYAPPVSVIAGDFVADQPLARSTDDERARPEATAYEEALDAEEQERHAAAERLKAELDEERPQEAE
jgi:hypothetical protein